MAYGHRASLAILTNIVHRKEDLKGFIPRTELLQIITVPILENPDVDNNFIGSLVVIPYMFFTIISISIIICGIWTWKYRNSQVVRASQPIFLWLILGGTLIFSISLIPITFDDGNSTIEKCHSSCQTRYWFPAIGITVIFAALFSKAWRLSKIVISASQLRRIHVTVADVIIPFVILLMANVLVLVTWNIHDPLTYIRVPHEGTDDWNRIISTYGFCDSKYSKIYGSILFVLSLVPMLLATIQTYRIRGIETLFNESTHIGIVLLVYGEFVL